MQMTVTELWLDVDQTLFHAGATQDTETKVFTIDLAHWSKLQVRLADLGRGPFVIYPAMWSTSNPDMTMDPPSVGLLTWGDRTVDIVPV